MNGFATLRIVTPDRDRWERLCAHPSALGGNWDPKRGTGTVEFSDERTRSRAERELPARTTCGAAVPDMGQSLCTRDPGHEGQHRCSAADVDARARTGHEWGTSRDELYEQVRTFLEGIGLYGPRLTSLTMDVLEALPHWQGVDRG